MIRWVVFDEISWIQTSVISKNKKLNQNGAFQFLVQNVFWSRRKLGDQLWKWRDEKDDEFHKQLELLSKRLNIKSKALSRLFDFKVNRLRKNQLLTFVIETYQFSL